MAPDGSPQGPKKEQKKPLNATFREFSFDDADAVTETPASAKAAFKDRAHRKPPADVPIRRTGHEKKWTVEFIDEQDRLEGMARTLLPKRPEIRLAIEEASDIDLLRIVAAGILEQMYRGKRGDEAVDALSAAALLADAGNFHRISSQFRPMTVFIAEELMMAETAPNHKSLLVDIASMEVESRTVYIALQTAALEMIRRGMNDGGIEPEKRDHVALSEMIAAAADGVDVELLQRAATLYNAVSAESGYTQSLRFTQDMKLEASPWPDIVASEPRKKPSNKPPRKSPKP